MVSFTSEDVRPPKPAALKKLQPFVLGGAAGCFATCCIQPIDMVKVQIQLIGASADASVSRNPITIAANMIQKNGFLSLYRGLDAGLVRQITYTTARLGLFRVFSDILKKRHDGTTLPLHEKAAAGLAAGAVGSFIGNPADLSLIRLQADTTLPYDQRRHYKGIIDAIKRIVKEEGFTALWRGSTPTIFRAMALNMGMLASFDQAKESLQPLLGNGWSTTLTASAISGFFAATLSLPFDFVKTRIQRMKPDPVTGLNPYRGFADCAMQVLKKEGPLAFYAGYPTFYVRIAPHAMITLITIDFLTKKIDKYYR